MFHWFIASDLHLELGSETQVKIVENVMVAELEAEAMLHINCSKLKAVLLALQSL